MNDDNKLNLNYLNKVIGMLGQVVFLGITIAAVMFAVNKFADRHNTSKQSYEYQLDKRLEQNKINRFNRQ